MESNNIMCTCQHCKCMATHGMATDREEVGVGVRKCIVCARNFKLYSQYSKPSIPKYHIHVAQLQPLIDVEVQPECINRALTAYNTCRTGCNNNYYSHKIDALTVCF